MTNRRQRESGQPTAVPNCGRNTVITSVQRRKSSERKKREKERERDVRSIRATPPFGSPEKIVNLQRDDSYIVLSRIRRIVVAVEERTEHNAAGKRSFFRVSRCNFNKSWISGWASMEWMRGGRAMGQGLEEQLANLVYHESGAPSTLRWINLSSRHHLHVRPLCRHIFFFSLFSVATRSLSRNADSNDSQGSIFRFFLKRFLQLSHDR